MDELYTRTTGNSHIITGGKVAYVGTLVGRWIDLMREFVEVLLIDQFSC